MQQRNIAFIGAGNMSKAIICGLVESGYPANLIVASNPSTPKLEKLQHTFSIKICQDNAEAVEQASVIVLAVKPQLMEQVCADLATRCNLHNKLFVSIAAGIPLARLQEMLGGEYPVVRTMPNTPSALGKGMTGLYALPGTEECEKGFVGDMMEKVGEIAWVDHESQIDGIIAAAGSSPAYFFLFLEAMQNEAVSQGFDNNTARQLVQQAMLGAAEMVCHNPDLEISELRSQVTSKGGTTAKAIETFQQHGLEQIIAQAMRAAVARAQEMSAQF